MLKFFVQMILGSWGMAVLDWCNNHLWVVFLVAGVYLLFMTLANRNFKRIKTALADRLVDVATHRKISSRQTLNAISLPVEEVIQQTSFFPFISRQKSFVVARTNANSVQRLADQDGLLDEVIARMKLVSEK